MEPVLRQLLTACRRLPAGTEWHCVVFCPAELEGPLNQLGMPNLTVLKTSGKYGADVAHAVRITKSKYLLTMEADFAHSPFVVPELYAYRQRAQVTIASRYILNGYSNTTYFRRSCSRAASWIIRNALDFPVKDLTSSLRLYDSRIFEETKQVSSGFDWLIEVLVTAYAAGFKIAEIPFHYYPANKGLDSKSVDAGTECLRSVGRLWKLRNSIDCADYDERAFRSRVWFQRSWQQRRYKHLVGMARDSERVLDVGCGSSQVIDGLPQSDCCDLRQNKLRYKRAPGRVLVRASVFDLPFKTDFYDAVVFSQVIEHIPRDPKILTEIVRVVKPGGYVIIGTPDYNTWWTTIEKIYGAVHPGGYADEHITHYTYESLKQEVESYGCTFVDHEYVWHAELIMRFRKN